MKILILSVICVAALLTLFNAPAKIGFSVAFATLVLFWPAVYAFGLLDEEKKQ